MQFANSTANFSQLYRHAGELQQVCLQRLKDGNELIICERDWNDNKINDFVKEERLFAARVSFDMLKREIERLS